jgi:chromosome segregation ATPase
MATHTDPWAAVSAELAELRAFKREHESKNQTFANSTGQFDDLTRRALQAEARVAELEAANDHQKKHHDAKIKEIHRLQQSVGDSHRADIARLEGEVRELRDLADHRNGAALAKQLELAERRAEYQHKIDWDRLKMEIATSDRQRRTAAIWRKATRDMLNRLMISGPGINSEEGESLYQAVVREVDAMLAGE